MVNSLIKGYGSKLGFDIIRDEGFVIFDSVLVKSVSKVQSVLKCKANGKQSRKFLDRYKHLPEASANLKFCEKQRK